MTNNYITAQSGLKLDTNLDFSSFELLILTHLKAHNVLIFVEPESQNGADETTRIND